MKGSSASAGGDDSLDLDAILAGGCAGGSGGNRASLKRLDADQSGTSDAKELAAALGAPVGIEASDATETRASSAAENCEGGGEEAGDEENYGSDENDDDGEGEDQGS